MKIHKLYWVHKAVILIAYLVDKYGLYRTLPPKAHDPGGNTPSEAGLPGFCCLRLSSGCVTDLLSVNGQNKFCVYHFSYILCVHTHDARNNRSNEIILAHLDN